MGAQQGQAWAGRQLLITHRLRERRCELGLTQKQVVTRLGRVGVPTTNRALSSLEHGTGVDVAKLPELAIALDCTITYLLGLTDDPHQWEPDHRHIDLTDRALHRREPAPPEAVATSREAGYPPSAPSWILGDEIPDRGSQLRPTR
jgi:transcriptional regulator with XRE-family HTH domain